MRTPFLFDVYPDLKQIPWQSLDLKVTPVQKLAKLGDHLGCANLWIKRDDLTTPYYGGNKPRKLEFIYPIVKQPWIFTIGGIGSNHCLATALLNFKFKLGFKVALALFPQELTADVQKKLLLFNHYGARLVQEREVQEDQMRVFNELGGADQIYWLFAGGSNSEGTVGFVDAAFELKHQIENKELPKPKYLVVTLGSGGTMAGLSLGLKLAGLDDIKLIGNSVVDKRSSNPRYVQSFAKKTLKHLRSFSDQVPDVEASIKRPEVSYDFFGGEYGKVTPEGLEAVELMKKHEKIVLDTTYTAKTVAFMIDFIKKNGIKDEPILYWHTYSSVDLSSDLNQLRFKDYLKLPKDFHSYFKQNIAGLPE